MFLTSVLRPLVEEKVVVLPQAQVQAWALSAVVEEAQVE
jgi:hypothetical protein